MLDGDADWQVTSICFWDSLILLLASFSVCLRGNSIQIGMGKQKVLEKPYHHLILSLFNCAQERNNSTTMLAVLLL